MANHLPAQLDAYLLSFPGAAWDYQPQWQWDRYRIDNHLFAAGCCPDAKYRTYGGRRLLTLRCDPQRAELLRAEFPAILPGFYTDKRTWISVDLDGGVPEDVLRDLCAAAHRIVFSKLPKYRRRELAPQAEETMEQPPVLRG